MNNANHAFRSHLMQQFAAQARTQSRPPLALMGLISEEDNVTATVTSSPTSSSNRLGTLHRRHSLQAHRPTPPHPALVRRNTHNGLQLRSSSQAMATPRFMSTAAACLQEEEHDHNSSSSVQPPDLSLLFQDMLQTRRSSSRFLPYNSSSTSSLFSSRATRATGDDSADDESSTSSTDGDEQEQELTEEQQYWMDVTERAVLCGCQAPNHKRTEPFTFKRMIAPSSSTERLADIFYQVTLRKEQQKAAKASTKNASSSRASTVAEMKQTAQKKRDKWSSIPAFLVTVVSSSSASTLSSGPFDSDDDSSSKGSSDNKADASNESAEIGEADDEYAPLPFVPPPTEQALEDYASACAATQNVLLSLHSEDIASKWVTGPVIRTRAFRDLVLNGENASGNHGSQTDRIIGLIPVGHYVQSKSTKAPTLETNGGHHDDDSTVTSLSSLPQFQHHGRRRRYKRPLHGDLLVDL